MMVLVYVLGMVLSFGWYLQELHVFDLGNFAMVVSFVMLLVCFVDCHRFLVDYLVLVS